MAAFERVLSGTAALDAVVDHIRMGDNVVWQVSSLDDFRLFADPYVRQALRDGRNLIYIRFAAHAPLVPEYPGMKVVRVELSHRFENFTYEIHRLIEREGRDAFYVFDCLSELQTAWATDLMMGNFFRLTCPFLFQLDTVAWFPILRGRHSFEAVEKIRETTQLFLDVYSGKGERYLRPVKVWNRTGSDMFRVRCWDGETQALRLLEEGPDVAGFYRMVDYEMAEDQNIDSWDRFFAATEMKLRAGFDVTEACARMCAIMVTRDERIRSMVREYFGPEDYLRIKKRMIGTGMIGGKACGMLLARRILARDVPETAPYLEEHDSFYIGSDVFYAFIVDNGLWDLRLRQRDEKEYFSLAPLFGDKLRAGSFSADIRAQFSRLLDHFRNEPIIVRSSSILEDGFDNAFAGKYESVFCANNRSPEENLAEFENAVRTVYASTMSRAALEYRIRRGLQKRDEQMALLVQRVSGTRRGDFLFPCAAGVGYSFSPYRMNRDIRAEDGMLRLVMGLGTAAVDRGAGTHPRIVQMTRPAATPYLTIAEKHRFSQQTVDVIDLAENRWASRPAEEVLTCVPPWLKRFLTSHDTEAEQSLRERGVYRSIEFVSCEGLVTQRTLMKVFSETLAALQRAYGNPVDIEYTVNLSPDGSFVINLLQCRPLYVGSLATAIDVPEDVPCERVLLESRNAGMGFSREVCPTILVVIDPRAYAGLGFADKSQVARTLGTVNWCLRDSGETPMLFTPGRICTSSPELGVPSTFAEISAFQAICEVSDQQAGFQPELSYGSHIFQDLVEAGILYTAVFEDRTTLRFNLSRALRGENLLTEMDPSARGLEDTIRVVRVSGCRLWYNMLDEHLLMAMEA